MGPAVGGLPLGRGARHRPNFRPAELVNLGQWKAVVHVGWWRDPFLPTSTASPLKQDEYPKPSVWGPQQHPPSALPCLLKPSRTHNVPVTRDITSSKTKTARMRKIKGDMRALEEEARELLTELLGNMRHPQQRLLWHQLKAPSPETGIKQRESSSPHQK
nr:PREDICTED: 39S ribosomal protein L49, mitochondrial [Struthio camelus australis]